MQNFKGLASYTNGKVSGQDSVTSRSLARISHTRSTASVQCSALTALRDPQAGAPGLLNVPYSTFPGGLCRAWRSALRPVLSPLRDDLV